MMNEVKQNNTHIQSATPVEEKIAPVKGTLRRSPLAKKLLVNGENLKQFEDFRAKILQEMLIHTEIENILCEKFIISAWKLQRAMEMEKILLNEQNEINDAERYGDDAPRKRVRNIKRIRLNTTEIRYIIQYQLELEKAMQKALERLREEQALRRSKESVSKSE